MVSVSDVRHCQTLSKRYTDPILIPIQHGREANRSSVMMSVNSWEVGLESENSDPRRAGSVANNARTLVAAVVDLGSFHDAHAWGNPSFDHFNIPNQMRSL